MYLPHAFSSAGHHHFVHLANPDRIDWRHGFFERGRPAVRPDDAIVPVDRWLAATDRPSDYSRTSGIFHVSRCGSTLLAQNLKATGRAVVLGEPPFMRIFRTLLDGTLSLDQARAIFSRVVGQWQEWAEARGKRLVIKFNSQSHRFREDIVSALPRARFVFLHREPVPVFESIARRPPRHVRRSASEIRHGRLAHQIPLSDSPLLMAAAENYLGALAAFAGSRSRVFPIGYNDLGRQFGSLAAQLGIEGAGHDAWRDVDDAKASDPSLGAPYRPVSSSRLEAFRREHRQLCCFAEAQYRTFLAQDIAAADHRMGSAA